MACVQTSLGRSDCLAAYSHNDRLRNGSVTIVANGLAGILRVSLPASSLSFSCMRATLRRSTNAAMAASTARSIVARSFTAAWPGLVCLLAGRGGLVDTASACGAIHSALRVSYSIQIQKVVRSITARFPPKRGAQPPRTQALSFTAICATCLPW